MKALMMWIGGIIWVFSLPVWTSPIHAGMKPQLSQGAAYVPDELLVKYRPSGKATASAYFREKWGITTLRTFGTINICHVKLPKDMSVDRALTICRDDDNVEYAEPNYYRGILFIPNDPFFPQQWGLHNLGQEINGTNGTPDADIDAPEAWNAPSGSGNIVIAVIDSGVDSVHPDLRDSLWVNPGEISDNGVDDDGDGYRDDVWGWDFVEDDNSPNDPLGHGTHVAGTIAAKSNNALGITGVCWAAKVIALRAFDSSGTGTLDDEIAAIEYAINHGAAIVNLSLGGYEFSQAEYDVLAAAQSSGILMIAAAGNSGTDNDSSPLYPASYELDNIISVAASNEDDDLADFSDYGVTTVDVAAPGVNIFGCIPVTKELSYEAYGFKTGTSMATAHVSGLAGLVWSLKPSLSSQEVKNAFLDSVDKIDSLSGKILTGGRINAYKALQNVVTLDPSAVAPYIKNSADTFTFLKVSNLGSERVFVDVEMMDEEGNRDTLRAIAKIPPHVTRLIWASDLASLATDITAPSFGAKLSFRNGTIDTIHTVCLMEQEGRLEGIPVYKVDKANADFPVVLFTPHLNISITYPASVRINNWSDNEAAVAVTVRSNDGNLVNTGSLPPLSAHTTGMYTAFDIASRFGIHDDSFSAEFAVYGEADKIFGVVCQQSEYGESIIPLYKNKSTTNSVYSYY